MLPWAAAAAKQCNHPMSGRLFCASFFILSKEGRLYCSNCTGPFSRLFTLLAPRMTFGTYLLILIVQLLLLCCVVEIQTMKLAACHWRLLVAPRTSILWDTENIYTTINSGARRCIARHSAFLFKDEGREESSEVAFAAHLNYITSTNTAVYV